MNYSPPALIPIPVEPLLLARLIRGKGYLVASESGVVAVHEEQS